MSIAAIVTNVRITFRRVSAALVLVLCALGVTVPAGAATKAKTTTKTASTAATTTAAPSPAPGYGVSFGGTLPNLTADQLDSTLTDVVKLGATWVREQAAWSVIQPMQSDYSWTAMDRVVSAVRSHGLSLDLVVRGTPTWARPAGCTDSGCAPADMNQFGAFAGAVASRYAPQGVHTFEVWNEPNNVAFWRQGANPTSYAAMLKAAVPAIRAADPAAQVISGGLAPKSTGNGSVDILTFTAGLCTANAVGNLDGYGVHPYSAPAPPGYVASWNAWSQMNALPRTVRSILAGCGAGRLPLWATEYGAPTDGPGAAVDASNWTTASAIGADHVTEDYQASLLREAVGLTSSSRDWLRTLFVYTNVDRGTARTTNENFYGLRRYDWTAKPAYAAVQSAIAATPAG